MVKKGPGAKSRITGVKVYVVVPELPKDLPGVPQGGWQWTFVQIDTDQGITGWGEASHPGNRGAFITGRAVLEIRDALIGEDAADIERIWHKLYRRYSFMGSRGLPTILVSAVDVALWDIKGKSLGRPIYDLLGGRFRDRLRLYNNGWFVGSNTPLEYADAAKRAVAAGHDALKLDPSWRCFHI